MPSACVCVISPGRRDDAARLAPVREELGRVRLQLQALRRRQAAGVHRREADERVVQRVHRVVDDLARRHDERFLRLAGQVIAAELVIDRAIRRDERHHAGRIEHIERRRRSAAGRAA